MDCPLLLNGNLLTKGDYRSSLYSFDENCYLDILNLVIPHIQFEKLSTINIMTFDWIIQCTGFALRVNDIEKEEKSLFKQSIDFYFRCLSDFPFPSLKQKYSIIFLLHISQSFTNPSILRYTSVLFKEIRRIFFAGRKDWNHNTIKVLLDVLLCAVEYLPQANDSNSIAILALDCLCAYNPPSQDYYHEFDIILEKCFQNESFIYAWLDRFEKLYRSNICSVSKKNNDESLLDFFVMHIEKNFNEKYRHRAFSSFVLCWHQASHRYVGVSSSAENLVFLNQPFCSTSDRYLHWFSIKGDYTLPRISVDFRWHPLFRLLEDKDAHNSARLISLVEEYLKFYLTIPQGMENLSYWLLPVHAHDYIIKWQYIRNNSDLIIDFVLRFSQALSVNNIYMVTLFDSLNQSFEKIVSNIWSSLATIICSISHYCENRTKLTNFLIYETIKSSNAIQFASLPFHNLVDMFWQKANSYFGNGSSNEEISAMTLFSGIVPHLFGKKFETLSPSSYSYLSSITKFLSSEEADFYSQIRTFIGLIFMSTSTNFFMKKQEIGSALVNYCKSTSDNQIIQLLKRVLYYMILTGGGDFSLSAELSDASIRTTEIYFTEEFIVSVVKPSTIVVRHILGTTVFEVNDLGERSIYTDEASPPESNEMVMPNTNIEQNDFENDDIARIDSLFGDDPDLPFYKFNKYRNDENHNPAHSILCDLGFLPLNNTGNIRRHSHKSYVDSMKTFDSIQKKPVIYVKMLHLHQENKYFELGSIDTPARRKFLNETDNDYIEVDTLSFKVVFCFGSIPNGCKHIDGFTCILNESGEKVNMNAGAFNKSKLLVSIIPFNDTYHVAIDMSKGFVPFSGFLIENIESLISQKGIGPLLSVLLLFYILSPDNNKEDNLYFILLNGFQNRKEIIESLFKNSSYGRITVLQGVLSPQTKK